MRLSSCRKNRPQGAHLSPIENPDARRFEGGKLRRTETCVQPIAGEGWLCARKGSLHRLGSDAAPDRGNMADLGGGLAGALWRHGGLRYLDRAVRFISRARKYRRCGSAAGLRVQAFRTRRDTAPIADAVLRILGAS